MLHHHSGGGDDALVLKSDYSVGRVLPVYNVIVRNSRISSNGCNALNFGSETVGDFSNITWENIVVEGAGGAIDSPISWWRAQVGGGKI
jgi:polygalacturonase